MTRFLSIFLALTQLLWGLPWQAADAESSSASKPDSSCCCCDEFDASRACNEDSAPCRPSTPSRCSPVSPCCSCYLPGTRVRLVARADRTNAQRFSSPARLTSRVARTRSLERPAHARPAPADAPTRRALLCIWTT